MRIGPTMAQNIENGRRKTSAIGNLKHKALPDLIGRFARRQQWCMREAFEMLCHYLIYDGGYAWVRRAWCLLVIENENWMENWNMTKNVWQLIFEDWRSEEGENGF